MKEIWKDVLGYEDLYQASNLGRIRSLGGRRGCSSLIKTLKQRKNSCGYLQVGLHKSGKTKLCSVHRLVWEAFIGKIPEGYEVNHIDEDKTNNFVYVNPDGSIDLQKSNLNLMTHKDNINWGTGIQRRAESRSMCVLQFTLDWNFVREWASVMECGRNGFERGHVSACCRGLKSYKSHKGFIWMFAEDFFRMLPEI